MTAAEQLRTEGQDLATDYADPRLIASIDAAVEKACKSGEEFSANDIRAEFPTVRPGLVGARFDRARKCGLMDFVGLTRSNLASTRTARICIWVGSEKARARLT